MEKFISHTGIAAPLNRINIDTDTIIPSRKMQSVSKKGLGRYAFFPWRFLPNGEENPEFVLNQTGFRQASILIVGKNFGCGSSREHAVWALKEFGIRAIVAPQFGAIFYKNCIRNGLLPVIASQKVTEYLSEHLRADDADCTIDLENRSIRYGDTEFEFEISDANRHLLLNGLDPIADTLSHELLIDEFIAEDRVRRPWAWL